MSAKRKSHNVTRQRASKRRDWRRAFLAAFAKCGTVVGGAEAARIAPETVHRAKIADKDFAAQFEAARVAGAYLLEHEATRRAVQGVQRLKFYEGQVIMVPTGKMIEREGEQVPEMTPYVEHEYSDALLALLLKRHFPNEYRENSKVEHSGGVKIVRLPAKEAEPA